jgi:hypothetical protein
VPESRPVAPETPGKVVYLESWSQDSYSLPCPAPEMEPAPPDSLKLFLAAEARNVLSGTASAFRDDCFTPEFWAVGLLALAFLKDG